MNNYTLINNHYVVHINNKNYIIDTGSPFTFLRNEKYIEINGRPYPSSNYMDESKYVKTSEFVGINIDGLIGGDILSKTSITIYKNGQLDFSILETEGDILPISLLGTYVFIECLLDNNRRSTLLIDTGAEYGYGDFSGVFSKNHYLRDIHDYNPTIGEFDSHTYEVCITINNKKYKMELGDSEQVTSWTIKRSRSAAVINISQIFEQYLVVDYSRRIIVLK